MVQYTTLQFSLNGILLHNWQGNFSRAGFLFKVVHERVQDSGILGFRGGLEGKEERPVACEPVLLRKTCSHFKKC